MPLNEFQLSFNGITLGENTPYEIYSVEGLGMVDISPQDQARFDTHGSVPTRHLMPKRIITVEFEAVRATGTELGTDLAAARSAMRVRVDPTDEIPLNFKLPGIGEKVVFGRPTKRRIPIDAQFARLNPKIVVEFECSDPRIYDATETVTNLTSGVNQAVTNNGNIDTYPTIIAQGIGNLQNVTRGQTIAISGANANQHTADLFDQTLFEGSTDRFNLVGSSSVWWSLGPGNTTVNVVGTNPQIRFRSAWDGI